MEKEDIKTYTAEQVIKMAKLQDDRLYMQIDTGSVDTGMGWKETILDLETRGEDSCFITGETHLVEVVKDQDGNWVEA